MTLLMEHEILDYWEEQDVFQQSLENTREKKPYIFYDGPPFATGLPHHGHLVASTIKDIVPRYWTMKGRYVMRRFGWDVHGLPIEHEIAKQLNLDGPRINQLCVAFDHIDTKFGITLDTVVWFDCGDNFVNPRHNATEVEARLAGFKSIVLRMTHLVGQFGSPDERLAWHAASVQAIATHFVCFHQRDLGF